MKNAVMRHLNSRPVGSRRPSGPLCVPSSQNSTTTPPAPSPRCDELVRGGREGVERAPHLEGVLSLHVLPDDSFALPACLGVRHRPDEPTTTRRRATTTRCANCLWSETLSPANWSVILSPHEGDDHVEPKGTDEGKGTDDGAGKEVHERRGSGATTRIQAPLTEA